MEKRYEGVSPQAESKALASAMSDHEVQAESKALASAMSDHEVQVDEKARLVSQNLQGPYAIKSNQQKDGTTRFGFDLPVHFKLSDEKDKMTFRQYTGMKDADSDLLYDAMFTSQNNFDDVSSVLKKIKGKNYPGVGDALGQGGFRISIESNEAYKKRMTTQMGHLKHCISGGADILTIQEQPYDFDADKTRGGIFKAVMEHHGYVSVAGLKDRDVGIWVQTKLKSNFKRPDKSLCNLVESAPFRGCVIEGNGMLIVNLHVDRQTAEKCASKLIELKTTCDAYAVRKGLQLSITGDVNLFGAVFKNDDNSLTQNGFFVETGKNTQLKEVYLKVKTQPVVQYVPPAPRDESSLLSDEAHPKVSTQPVVFQAPRDESSLFQRILNFFTKAIPAFFIRIFGGGETKPVSSVVSRQNYASSTGQPQRTEESSAVVRPPLFVDPNTGSAPSHENNITPPSN